MQRESRWGRAGLKSGSCRSRRSVETNRRDNVGRGTKPTEEMVPRARRRWSEERCTRRSSPKRVDLLLQYVLFLAVAFFQGLDHVQTIVFPVSCKQFFMGSVLGDCAVHQYDDAV